MFDLNWLDKIRDYVNYFKMRTIFLDDNYKDKIRLNYFYNFLNSYDILFVNYICELYNIKQINIRCFSV